MGSPSDDDLRRLPRWAAVAFAARCADRVRGLISRHGPRNKLGPPAREVIELVQALASGDTSGSMQELSRLTNQLSANLRSAVEAGESSRESEVTEAVLAAIFASASAQSASRKPEFDLDPPFADMPGILTPLLHPALGASLAATSALNAARLAGLDAVAVLDAHRFDFELLRSESEIETWDDDTAVGPEFFGELWPSGQPENWMGGYAEAVQVASMPLPLTIYVKPGTAPPEEIGELLAEISSLYRMLGGSGITFSLEGLYTPAEEAVPS